MVRQEDWRRDHPATNPAYTALAELSLVLTHLSPRDLTFAESLAAQYQARSNLSEKQLFWVRELAKRGQAVATPAAPQQAPTPQASAAPASREFLQILALFAKAGSRAAIVFRTINSPVDHGAPIEFRLSVAGERSQQPGSINVTDTSSGFSDRTWYGRISTAGVWQPSRKIEAAIAVLVEAALTRFDADPAAAAADYGHTTSHCCFCRRDLTDERSVTVGYGPICAERWGLPWGEVTGPAPENKLTCDVPF
jgi:hypothetical protein